MTEDIPDKLSCVLVLKHGLLWLRWCDGSTACLNIWPTIALLAEHGLSLIDPDEFATAELSPCREAVYWRCGFAMISWQLWTDAEDYKVLRRPKTKGD